jgi:integrase
MPTPTLEIRNGVYYALWSENRRSKRKSMGTSDRAAAEQRFAQWLLLGGHKGGAVGEAKPSLTVAELWSVYEAKHVPTTAAPATLRYSWRNLEPHFGKLAVAEIDQTVVDEYEDARLEAGAKTGTVRRELVTLRAMLNWHASPERGRKRLLEKADVPAFTLPDESAPRDRWLTTDEIKRLLAAAEGRTMRVQMFLRIALETAARKQAIYDLTWDRVDFETGMIHFAVPGRAQTKKRRVSVPMSDALITDLNWYEPCLSHRVGPVLPPGGDVWAAIQSCVIRAGLAPKQKRGTGQAIKSTGISPHTLRHTAATHMARRGVPLYDIAGVLGNSVAVVERTYAHHCPARLKAAVNMISGTEVTK